MSEFFFSRVAALEYDEYAAREERKRAGAGFDYEQDVFNTIEHICESPIIYEVKFKPDVRRVPLKQFPYLVLYRFENNQVHILAIGHKNRKPEYWEERAASF